MRRGRRYYTAMMILLLLIGASFKVIQSGLYGWTVFVILPAILGGLACWAFPPKGPLAAIVRGAYTVAGACLILPVIRVEGFACVLMTLPLIAPMGSLGGWIFYKAMAADMEPRGAAMMLFLPLASLTFDLNVAPTVFKIHSEVVVAATPEQVWKHVVTFSDLPEPDEWYFHTGLAYPKRAHIEGSGAGAIRYCEFSTGSFVEPIEVWDEPRLLAFRVVSSPAPMHEWSPYGEVSPKHLHGYLISKHGEFRLTPMPGGRTLLEGTTWYQHGLWPGEYWRWWSDAIIHRIHVRVLHHVKMLAEREAFTASQARIEFSRAAPQRVVLTR